MLKDLSRLLLGPHTPIWLHLPHIYRSSQCISIYSCFDVMNVRFSADYWRIIEDGITCRALCSCVVTITTIKRHHQPNKDHMTTHMESHSNLGSTFGSGVWTTQARRHIKFSIKGESYIWMNAVRFLLYPFSTKIARQHCCLIANTRTCTTGPLLSCSPPLTHI